MLISVLIFAYNRREYILNALNSVIDQTLESDRYEVVILSNFQDAPLMERIDRYKKNMSIKIVLLGDLSIGTYILKGLENSRGDIVTFLDDDDLYERTRLAEVAKIFDENKEVVYYRNAVRIIDQSGRLISISNSNKWCKSGQYSLEEISKNGMSEFQWEMSTIALRRIILEKYKEFLPNIINAQDAWMFYLSLSERKMMYLDCKELTKYRINEGQVTSISGEYNHFIRGYRDTKPLMDIIGDKDILIELQKTRARMLFLSITKGYKVSNRELLGNMVFYLRNIKVNRRDIRVVAFFIPLLILFVPFQEISLRLFSRFAHFLPRR